MSKKIRRNKLRACDDRIYGIRFCEVKAYENKTNKFLVGFDDGKNEMLSRNKEFSKVVPTVIWKTEASPIGSRNILILESIAGQKKKSEYITQMGAQYDYGVRTSWFFVSKNEVRKIIRKHKLVKYKDF